MTDLSKHIMLVLIGIGLIAANIGDLVTVQTALFGFYVLLVLEVVSWAVLKILGAHNMIKWHRTCPVCSTRYENSRMHRYGTKEIVYDNE